MTSRKVDIMKNFKEFCCGQPIEGMKGRPDGCIVDVTDSGVSVLVLMNRPTPKEISQFEGGKGVKVKLLSLRGIIFFIIKVGDNGWMDAPYNVHLSKNLKKLQKVVDGEGYAMHIMLIDTFTGKLVKQKLYGMPHDTSKNLYKMVMEQRKKFLNKEKYEENIKDIYGTYSTKKLLKFAS